MISTHPCAPQMKVKRIKLGADDTTMTGLPVELNWLKYRIRNRPELGAPPLLRVVSEVYDRSMVDDVRGSGIPIQVALKRMRKKSREP